MATQLLEQIDMTAVSIRNYRDGDQKLLADMINETDQVDRFDRRTTVDDLQHEWQDPHFTPAKDGFAAVVRQDGAQRAIAAGDVYLGALDDAAEQITVYSWHVVRPEWRGSGVGRQIIQACYGRARELVADIADPRPKVFRASAHAADVHARRRLDLFGMEHVRTSYTMEYAPLDESLPAPDAPPGLSIVPWTPAATVIFDFLERHWPTLVNGIESNLIPTPVLSLPKGPTTPSSWSSGASTSTTRTSAASSPSRVRGCSWVSSRSCTASLPSPRPALMVRQAHHGGLSKGRSTQDSRQVSPGVGRLRHLRRCRRQSGAYRFSLCRPQRRLAPGVGSESCPQLMTVAHATYCFLPDVWYNQYLGISFDHPPAGFDYVMQHALQTDLGV